MKCKECGSSNPKGAQFCNKCGAKLGIFCPECNAPIESGDKFCKKCGHALEQATESTKTTQKKKIETKQQIPEENTKKPKKKVPIWLIIILGIIVVLCGLVAIFGDISFNIGKPSATQTATHSATVEAIVLPTATPEVTPTLEPIPTPEYGPVYVEIVCNSDKEALQYAMENQPLRIGTYLTASEEEKDAAFIDFINNSVFSVMVDGQDIASLLEVYEPFYDEMNDEYRMDIDTVIDPLPIGLHHIETTITFSDTFALPNSNDEIMVGPGTDYEQISAKCPFFVGGLDESWQPFATSDFSEPKGIFNDSQGDTEYFTYNIEESHNGKFMFSVAPFASTPENYMISMYHPLLISPTSTDFFITFNATIAQKAEIAEYGLSFREDANGNAYTLSIDPSNQNITFYIYQVNSSDPIILFNESVPELIPDGTNEISVLASGENILIWINHRLVGSAIDSTLTNNGPIAFIIDAVGQGTTIYEFDNLIARSPVE